MRMLKRDMQTAVKHSKLRMLSTLKEKRHYLVLVSDDCSEESIKKAILDFIGTLGYSKAGVFFIESDKAGKKSYFIASVVSKHVDDVKAAVALMKPRVKCIGVSGTIKNAREKFVNSIS